MGADCFTHRVCRTQVPIGFKLPHDHQKYDGSQEPESWLSDYLQAVKILGGSKGTSMQSLQLHLSGAARSWLRKLPEESIGSWDELTNDPRQLKRWRLAPKNTTSPSAPTSNVGASCKIQKKMSPTSRQSMPTLMGYATRISLKIWDAPTRK
jgi:hypothetical protein